MAAEKTTWPFNAKIVRESRVAGNRNVHPRCIGVQMWFDAGIATLRDNARRIRPWTGGDCGGKEPTEITDTPANDGGSVRRNRDNANNAGRSFDAAEVIERRGESTEAARERGRCERASQPPTQRYVPLFARCLSVQQKAGPFCSLSPRFVIYGRETGRW